MPIAHLAPRAPPRRARTRPRGRRDDGALTYAELLAARPARRRAAGGAGRPRGARGCAPGAAFGVALHAAWLARAVPVDCPARSARDHARREGASTARDRGPTRRELATTSAPRSCSSPRARAGAQARRADLRQLAVERARLGRGARARPRGALAVHAAARARRRPVDPRSAARHLRDDGDRPRALRRRPGRATRSDRRSRRRSSRSSRRRSQRLLDAGLRTPAAPALGAARRRADHQRAAGRAPPPRRARRSRPTG